MKESNPKNNQRITALNLLEKQLIVGTKPAKIDGKTYKYVDGKIVRELIPLTESDRARITREINILKAKIV